MKRFYLWLLAIPIVFGVGLAINYKLSEVKPYQKIDVYLANGMQKTGLKLLSTIRDKDTLDTVSSIMKGAQRMGGILDVAAPEYVFQVHEDKSMKTVFVWLGESGSGMQGMLMYAEDTYTGYSISMKGTEKLRTILASLNTYKSKHDLTAINIILPDGWKLDTRNVFEYSFLDESGKPKGWIAAEAYEEDPYVGWQPNHSETTSEEAIDIPLGKGKLFISDMDNGTAASGVTGTHDLYFAIIPVEGSNIRYVIEFSQMDKRPEKKLQFLEILSKIGFRTNEEVFSKEAAIAIFKKGRNIADDQVIDCILINDSKLPKWKAVLSFYSKENNSSCNLAFISADAAQVINFAVNKNKAMKDFELLEDGHLSYLGDGAVKTSIRNIKTNEIIDYTIVFSYKENLSFTNFKVTSKKRK